MDEFGQFGLGPSDFQNPVTINCVDEYIAVLEEGNFRTQFFDKNFTLVKTLITSHNMFVRSADSCGSEYVFVNIPGDNDKYLYQKDGVNENLNVPQNYVPRLYPDGSNLTVFNSAFVRFSKECELYYSYKTLPFIFSENYTLLLKSNGIKERVDQQRNLNELNPQVRTLVSDILFVDDKLYLLTPQMLFIIDITTKKVLESFRLLMQEGFSPRHSMYLKNNTLYLSTFHRDNYILTLNLNEK